MDCKEERDMSRRTNRKTVFAAATGVALIALLTGPGHAGAQDRAAIEARLDLYEQRFNAADAEAVSRFFAEDVVYYGPLGEVFEGRDAVEDRYRRNLEAGFSDMDVEVLEIRILGDTAYDLARYEVTGPDGELLSGHHLAIMEKQDGAWIVRRTLVNAKMPAPPAQ
jgi:uncharacterized protein (TIGR02246 family)